MLKKTAKGREYFTDLPSKPENEQVNPINPSGSGPETDGLSRREASERNAHVVEKGVTSVEKMIDRFLASRESLDLARVNDTILRIAARLPERRSGDGALLKNFYSKLKSNASRSMAARRERSNPLDLEGLTVASKELMDKLENLESSVTQLLNIIDARREHSPESSFATSVDLDVRYGIDLIEAIPHFVAKRDTLEVDFNLYQCKAKRVGLSDDEIRKLAQQYRIRAGLATNGEHLVIDPAYFEREIATLESKAEAPVFTDEELLEGLLTDGALFRETLAQMKHPDSRTAFIAQRKIHQFVEGFAQRLGEQNPLPAPQIKIGRIEMLFGVDTKQGLRILTLGEAERFTSVDPNMAVNRPQMRAANYPTLAK